MPNIPFNGFEIIFETESDMQDALSKIKDVLDSYGNLSYNDFAVMFDTMTHFSYEKYGWVDFDLITTRINISMNADNTFSSSYSIIFPKLVTL